MERGGGERQEFGDQIKTSREVEDRVTKPETEVRFAPIKHEPALEPAPVTQPAAEHRTQVPEATATTQSAHISAEDIRRDVPVDELDGLEDKILAGMEQ